MSDPLIVTLALDAVAQQRLDALRARWFPARRNHLAAHVTLFHALPGAEADRVRSVLAEVGAAQAPMDVEVAGVLKLGRGVALRLDVPGLDDVHRSLARPFTDVLTRQDAQRLRAHVTVANKLAPARATELADELTEGFRPWSATATGLALWWYRGGPWEHVGTTTFDG